MITINTTDDLLSHLKDGRISFEDDVAILCDVPYSGVGEKILYLECGGDLDCGGNLYCRGYLHCGGDLDCWGYLDCGGDLYCGGYLNCWGYLNCGGNCAIFGTLYWSQMSKPVVNGKFFHRRVFPQAWQREYWQERLGMDISDGCYNTIIAAIMPELPKLLRRKTWTPTERWMLESLRLVNAEAPEWVEKMGADK